jgi:hypothetical protein
MLAAAEVVADLDVQLRATAALEGAVRDIILMMVQEVHLQELQTQAAEAVQITKVDQVLS